MVPAKKWRDCEGGGHKEPQSHRVGKGRDTRHRLKVHFMFLTFPTVNSKWKDREAKIASLVGKYLKGSRKWRI